MKNRNLTPEQKAERQARKARAFHQRQIERGIGAPQIQNIPIKTELGREIRRAFQPRPGTVLYSTNYSALEIQIAAEIFGGKDRA